MYPDTSRAVHSHRALVEALVQHNEDDLNEGD